MVDDYPTTLENTPRTVLVVGASRGLGLAVTGQFVERGWRVIATVRSVDSPGLAALAADHPGLVEVRKLDIADEAQIDALTAGFEPGSLDVLYVNAGIAGDDVPVGEVSTDDFTRVMVTNALAPMRVVEKIGPLVADGGMIAVVSSRQGSVSINMRGGHEVYRASKSALNQLMRSYAARADRPNRTLLLLHPGWVQTGLGGDAAPLTVAESSAGLANVVEENLGADGLQFLDHTGQPVAW